MAHYNLKWLQEKFDRRESIDFLFFWGHTNQTDEPVGNFICSQWYPSPFTIHSITYKTAEHWMMTEKARLFKDADMEDKIIHAQTPKKAKELGRKVHGFNAETWNSSCFDIVVQGNKEKFTQNEGYAAYLCSTGHKVIVEASPVDTIWGIGLTQDSEQARNPYSWRGQNLLGFALMEVRDMVKQR